MQESPSREAPPSADVPATGANFGQSDDPSPMWEQRSALLIGFSTGMLIAAIFLVYVVLSAANALP